MRRCGGATQGRIEWVNPAYVKAVEVASAAEVGGRQWQAAHPQAVAPFVTDNRR